VRMAITKGCTALLLDECRRSQFHGSVMQLGRHTIYLTMGAFQEQASLHGVTLKAVSPTLSTVAPVANIGGISDVTYFSSLGLETIESCDISDIDGATYVLDLNRPVPEVLYNRYDLIIDSGTSEHIFDLPQVLRNLHSMLKVGGRIIFMFTPATNFVDHGYYMFSPILFYDYFTINNYLIHSAFLIRHTVHFADDPYEIIYYEPGVLDPFSYGGCCNGNMLSTWFCVEKTVSSTCDVIPQQGCSYGSDTTRAKPELRLYSAPTYR